jgi:hypothetical protein
MGVGRVRKANGGKFEGMPGKKESGGEERGEESSPLLGRR